MSADNLKIFFPLRFPFPNSIWLVVLRVVKKIYINASIDIFNQDTKLVDVDGLRSSLTPLSKLCVQIKSETLLKSWKPFYF